MYENVYISESETAYVLCFPKDGSTRRYSKSDALDAEITITKDPKTRREIYNRWKAQRDAAASVEAERNEAERRVASEALNKRLREEDRRRAAIQADKERSIKDTEESVSLQSSSASPRPDVASVGLGISRKEIITEFRGYGFNFKQNFTLASGEERFLGRANASIIEIIGPSSHVKSISISVPTVLSEDQSTPYALWMARVLGLAGPSTTKAKENFEWVAANLEAVITSGQKRATIKNDRRLSIVPLNLGSDASFAVITVASL